MTHLDAPTRTGRRGTFVPFLALVVTGLFAFLALAIDIGMLAVSATECQSAADGAALVATRNLDNKPTSSNSNASVAEVTGRATVTNNYLFAAKFTAGSVGGMRFGTYEYNTVTQQFEVAYPSSPPPGRSWTATEVTVNGSQPAFFGRMFGSTGLSVARRAVAVHRPRDVAVVMDMTGSMRFGSTLNANGSFLSADPLYPQAGHYDRYLNYTANNPNTSSTGGTSEGGRHNPFFTTTGFVAASGELYAPNNYTVQTAGGPAAVKDFFYTPSNLSNPSTTATTVAPNMAAVAPATPLPRAFHHWEPTPSSPGDPDNYIAPVFTYGGWSYDPAGFTHYPTPDTFRDQSHVSYLGDRFPRKKGEEAKSANRTAEWDFAQTTGAAVNLAEYLGWIPDVTTGSGTPNPNSGTQPARPNAAAHPTRTWANFRDAIWEEYGYDLDVTKYIAQRAVYGWDARNPVDTTVRNFIRDYVRKPADERFKGYSMGPGYWGKTFFMWPPDPRWGKDDTGAVGGAGNTSPPNPTAIHPDNPVKDTAGNWIADWRRRFFLKADGTPFDSQGDNNTTNTGTNTTDGVNEVLLTNGAGNTIRGLNAADGMKINYAAVLKWIKSPPMALPPNLRAGRVLYYSSIPDDVNTGSGSAEDKAFWKLYIDYVLNGSSINTFESKGWPNGATPGVFTNDLTGYTFGTQTDPKPYMNYLDNPSRPRAQFWFGPVSMMAYLASARGNAWAGTVHETQTWQLKAGMNSALDDIRNNHPNDSVGMAYFSHGGYKFVSVALGQEWQVLKAALFYPQTLVDNGQAADPTKEFRAYDANGNYRGSSDIPNAQGATDPNTGLAMGFNILSPSTANIRRTSPPSPFANPSAPRSGRRGASKIVIFETDGVPNSRTDLAFNAAGYNSYYTVTGNGANYGNGSNESMDAAYAVADQIVKPMLAGTAGDSGLSTPNSPARVYAIGFGDLFSTPSATFQPQARAFLLNLQKHGKTSGPTDTAIPASQIITGPSQTRIDSLRTCFERILQSGVQVTLVE